MQGRKCSFIFKIHTNYTKQIGAYQSRMKKMKNGSDNLPLSKYCDMREVTKSKINNKHCVANCDDIKTIGNPGVEPQSILSHKYYKKK